MEQRGKWDQHGHQNEGVGLTKFIGPDIIIINHFHSEVAI